jgi:hypothetical protein
VSRNPSTATSSNSRKISANVCEHSYGALTRDFAALRRIGCSFNWEKYLLSDLQGDEAHRAVF